MEGPIPQGPKGWGGVRERRIGCAACVWGQQTQQHRVEGLQKECLNGWQLAQAAGMVAAHQVSAGGAPAPTWSRVRLSDTSVDSLRSFFQPYRRSDTMVVSSLGTRTWGGGGMGVGVG